MYIHVHTHLYNMVVLTKAEYLECSSFSSSRQQVKEGGLAAARRSHDANHLPRVEVDRYPFEYLFDDTAAKSLLHFFSG